MQPILATVVADPVDCSGSNFSSCDIESEYTTDSVRRPPPSKMSLSTALVAALVASAAAAPDVILATFDGSVPATTFDWTVKNDPVMGGGSTSHFAVTNGSEPIRSPAAPLLPQPAARTATPMRSTVDDIFTLGRAV